MHHEKIYKINIKTPMILSRNYKEFREIPFHENVA